MRNFIAAAVLIAAPFFGMSPAAAATSPSYVCSVQALLAGCKPAPCEGHTCLMSEQSQAAVASQTPSYVCNVFALLNGTCHPAPCGIRAKCLDSQQTASATPSYPGGPCEAANCLAEIVNAVKSLVPTGASTDGAPKQCEAATFWLCIQSYLHNL